MIKKPQRVVQKRNVYRGWIKLENHYLQIDDDADMSYDVIKNTDGCAALVFVDDETVLLQKQYRYPLDLVLLEVTQGGVEKDEEPIEAIERELLEETGYTADFEPLSQIYHWPTTTTSTIHIFLGRNGRKIAEPVPDPIEECEIVLMKFQDLLDEVMEGKHRDPSLCDAVKTYALKFGIKHRNEADKFFERVTTNLREQQRKNPVPCHGIIDRKDFMSKRVGAKDAELTFRAREQ